MGMDGVSAQSWGHRKGSENASFPGEAGRLRLCCQGGTPLLLHRQNLA